MKLYTYLFLTLFIVACIAIASCNQNQQEKPSANFELTENTLEIKDPWARPGRNNGVTAVYLHILNGLENADTLLALSSPDAELVELHETYDRGDGMMGMRQAEEPVFPANEVKTMQPGGLHIMLMQLNRELTEGDEVEISLTFSLSGVKTIRAPVRSPD